MVQLKVRRCGESNRKMVMAHWAPSCSSACGFCGMQGGLVVSEKIGQGGNGHYIPLMPPIPNLAW